MHLAYQCSFLFVCFEGLYAGHPYIHLISFEIFLLACYHNDHTGLPRTVCIQTGGVSIEQLPLYLYYM